MPNNIVHVAQMVHTPVGSAPSGMVLYQPDPNKPPMVMGFMSHDVKVGAYFGPHIFAGTPFEQAPVLEGKIEIESDFPRRVFSKVTLAGVCLEVEMTDFGSQELIHRVPAVMPPFWQQGVESVPAHVTLKVNGQQVEFQLPPVGISGGPAAVWTPCGLYAR